MQEIRIINALIPLEVGGAVYITDKFCDVERVAKMNVTNEKVAIRTFIKNGIVIFWNADIFDHQAVINRTKDFPEYVLNKFGLTKVDLNEWYRGIVFFKENDQGFFIEAIDPRTKEGKEELFKFLKKE